MKTRRVSISAATALGLLASVLAAVPASADAAQSESSAVATGQVVNDTRDAVAGAGVELHAWPSNDVTEKMDVGDSANLQIVTSTVTAADGTFSLRIADTSSLLPLTGADKVVNFTFSPLEESPSRTSALPGPSISSTASTSCPRSVAANLR